MAGVGGLGFGTGGQDADEQNTASSASQTTDSCSEGSSHGRDAAGLGTAHEDRSLPAQPSAQGLWGPHFDTDAMHEGVQVAQAKPSFLATLTLRQDVILDTTWRRVGYQLVTMIIRVLPALVIYGGTLSFLVCVFFKYRWGVLLSLLTYTLFMVIATTEMVLFSAYGLIMCSIQGRNDWYGMHCRRVEKESAKQNAQSEYASASRKTSCNLAWNDVFHVVMIPTYKTPYEILVTSMHALEQFSLARTNMGVIFAFEEREDGCDKKALDLQRDFGEQFAFITKAFHPPNLPQHVPGKSSNECWAFFELVKELKQEHGFEPDDPRVVITVIDDDSELHENYFEALTYHFLEASEARRYLTIWQPPIVHFKNFLSQPALVRVASTATSLHELACLSNPLDCHVPFSSYSLSLMLAASVGGWDPDFISEDWHMFAKCSLMTEGRVRVRGIFLPLVNYAPEEDTFLATIQSRWTQAKRHALGVSEIVYVVTSMYLGILELASPVRAITFLWRMLPVLGKFVAVHFTVATIAVWPVLSHVLINVYMWRSWCYIDELEDTCKTCCVPVAAASDFAIGQERVIMNSWMVYFQQQANLWMCVNLLIFNGYAALYFHLIRDRVDGDVAGHFMVSNPFLHWLRIQLEGIAIGWPCTLAFGSIPEWIAVVRIMVTLQFTHVVAGMVGRSDGDGAL